MRNVLVGRQGEEISCRFLQKQDYKIIDRNFRIRGGEIDIIAIDGNTLVYVEVKTRTSHRFGLPEESITYNKLKFLQRAAKFYRNNNHKSKLPNLERIDLVTVDFTNNPIPAVKLIKNITS